MGKFFARFVHYLILGIFALIVLVPLVWGVMNAFRSNDEIFSMSGLNRYTFFPERFTMENFTRMFTMLNFVTVFGNTIFVAVTVTGLSMLFNTMAGYAFSRLDFAFKRFFFLIIISTLIMPMEVLILPLYSLMRGLNMTNTFSAVIIPFMASAFGIFFMRQFFMGIPRELDESAYLDGCGYFRSFFHILLPLTKTPLITLGLIAFLGQWDGFIIPVTFLSGEKSMLLQVALAYISLDTHINDNGIIFAGLLVSSLPIVVLFTLLQKYYVAGIATTGLKG